MILTTFDLNGRENGKSYENDTKNMIASGPFS
jgi:hypothetical protein